MKNQIKVLVRGVLCTEMAWQGSHRARNQMNS